MFRLGDSQRRSARRLQGTAVAALHTRGATARRRRWAPVALALAVAAQLLALVATATPASAACVLSAIACENQLAGTPQSTWDVYDGGSDVIDGFTTDISTNVGGTVKFKVRSNAAYTVDIYRVGYYGGNGARKVATINNGATLPASNQPACITDATTGNYDCGTWNVSTQWVVPATAVSGLYFARVNRPSDTEANHIVFIVRNDASTSNIIFQTSDMTWQAYNAYGGASLYNGGTPYGRALKVSYNRPFSTKKNTPYGRDFVWANEYPMIRWMERNGYDMSYQSGVDTERLSTLANHKTFVSVGHDEYWTGAQRTKVEQARDAGVNLAFFSGNEMYWKGRWENSIDGTNTAYRTYVTYKETRNDAKIDPNPMWTGTFRDPRFSPPSDGGRPENAVTGTWYRVNCCNVALKVPAADGKMRFWRNTPVATQAAGSTLTLSNDVIGYEFDEVPDNGFQPAGQVLLSSTTAAVSEYLTDWGSTVAPGTATHNLSLYRAASGALVFGAGTVQWSWGLDDVHDGSANPPQDVRMQQATLNLFADMGAQPATRQANLAAATKSTDATAPTVTITSPAANSNANGNTNLTISGTATDAGGQVGMVEVSTDNGASYHRATGRSSWTYAWPVNGQGVQTIKVRAADDSGNISVPLARSVNTFCPCTVFGGKAPFIQSYNDNSAVTLGMKFRADTNGWITGVRFYKGPGNTGTHIGSLWSPDGTRLATGTFTAETAAGWQTMTFPGAVAVTANTTYIASYYAPVGHYAGDRADFTTKGYDLAPMHGLQAGIDGPNGVYQLGDAFPSDSFGSTNYWVDASFTTVEPPDTIAPTASVGSPFNNAGSIPTNTTVTVKFNEGVQLASVNFTLQTGTTNIPGTTSYDAANKTVIFTPTAPLGYVTNYTARVSGAKDAAGNTMAGTLTWAFTTAGAPRTPGVCPCTVWQDSDSPAVQAVNDGSSVELGVKFRADVDGKVTGVRFYKGMGNTGTHTGSVWTAAGVKLGSVTFANESFSGWQQALFSTPINVSANTTYVVSYFAPVGRYAATSGLLGQPVDNAPLHLLKDGVDGNNGVYKYGAASIFPDNSYNASYYWVEPVFTKAPDVAPPTVVSTTPVAGGTNELTATVARATFSEDIQPGTATFTLSRSSGPVAGTVSYDAASRTLSFTPTGPLAASTTYTATVNGAKDLVGNTQTVAKTWSFTTGGTCPCSLFPATAVPGTPSNNDSGSVNLGMRFAADVNGQITAIRFYKGSGNDGTHTGTLWTAAGVQLATVTFTNETASGWQTATLSSPVAVTAGTAYVVSYHAPVGRYAGDLNVFNSQYDNGPLHGLQSVYGAANGLYAYGPAGTFPVDSYQAANYWVDVVFTPGP